MPPKGYKKHCCACVSSAPPNVGVAVYCCIGKARWCAKHKRWYQKRNELLAAASKLDAELVVLDSKF